MKNYIILFLLICFTSCVLGQKNTNKRTLVVSGKITDETGAVITSVSVNVNGKSTGTTSSSGGLYSIKNVSDGDSIRFTHIAYQPVIIAVKGNNLINLEMKQARYRLWNYKVTDSVKKATVIVKVEEKETYFFEKVEIMPSFKGGKNALYKYFKETIKYPEEAKQNNIEGEVVVGFVVGIEGEIKNIKIVTGISPACDQVAFNAIKNMSNWVYAIQNGRKIEVYIELSISFSLIPKD